MNEQYEKSLSKLELDKVLSLLADHASSQAAKDRCMAIRPSADADEIRHLLEETSAACKCITIKGSPSFGGLYDVGASLDRAYRGGCLSPEELLRIACVLRAARQAKSYAEGEGAQEASVLDLYFQQITSNKYLEERIFNSILSKDEIADAASSELASIRRKIRQQSAKIRESLQKIITSPSYAKILQEPIVTIRSDRFVVPVKAECKGQLPGLVHDVSSSGSTYFIEPMSAVNGNNELRELFMAERKEIERILAELSAESADHREQIKLDYDVLLELECIFARARLSFAMRAICPEVRTDGQLNLIRARHPLITGKTVVPISVRLGSDFDTLIITGPNTGGKTVTLKTIGLLTLMAECGLHIPPTTAAPSTSTSRSSPTSATSSPSSSRFPPSRRIQRILWRSSRSATATVSSSSTSSAPVPTRQRARRSPSPSSSSAANAAPASPPQRTTLSSSSTPCARAAS